MNKKTCPLVSVVMSVYNGEKYLREAIDSILSQTFTDFEFIIINDGSTDDTLKIIKSYKDPRIVLISRKNLGLVASLNEGINLASGKYIARQDADDVSLPQRLSKQVEYLKLHEKCAVVGSRIQEIDDVGVPHYRVVLSNELPNDSLELSLFFCNPLAHGTVLMRTDIVRAVGGYKTEHWPAEDYELWGRMSKVGRLAVLDEVLYLYRFNSEGISLSNLEKQTKAAESIRQELLAAGLFMLDNCKYLAPNQVIHVILRYNLRHFSFSNLLKIAKLKTFKFRAKKSIVLTSSAKSIGGGEVYIRQIISNLSSKYDFTLIAPKELHFKFSDQMRYRRIDLPDWFYSLNVKGAYFIKSLKLKTFRLKNIDLVHVQQLDDVLTRFFSNFVPIVFTAHSRLRLEGQQLAHVRTITRRLRAAVSVAKVLNPDLKKLGLTSRQVAYIPNAIDGQNLTELDMRRKVDQIVWVGRLERGDKNPDLFLDIAKKMPKEYFCMYGEGSYKNVLLDRIKSEKIGNIEIRGFEKDIQKIYLRASLLCLTSESEAMPLVVLEALAAAVPIVSTKVGDVEAVLSSGGGVCVSAPRAESFVREIGQILKGRKKYSASARDNYLKNYKIEKMIASLDKFYGEMIR